MRGKVCLKGGRSSHEGNVYMGTGSVSRPVCDDSWDANDGLVVCRELGYHGLVKVSCPSQEIGSDVFCEGHQGERIWHGELQLCCFLTQLCTIP